MYDFFRCSFPFFSLSPFLQQQYSSAMQQRKWKSTKWLADWLTCLPASLPDKDNDWRQTTYVKHKKLRSKFSVISHYAYRWHLWSNAHSLTHSLTHPTNTHTVNRPRTTYTCLMTTWNNNCFTPPYAEGNRAQKNAQNFPSNSQPHEQLVLQRRQRGGKNWQRWVKQKKRQNKIKWNERRKKNYNKKGQ